MLGDGRLHLSGIVKLAPHITDKNRADLLNRATHASRRKLEELVAEVAPRPDVPVVIRKLPGPKQAQKRRRPSGSSRRECPLRINSVRTECILFPARPALQPEAGAGC